jgi:hypothetical protein
LLVAALFGKVGAPSDHLHTQHLTETGTCVCVCVYVCVYVCVCVCVCAHMCAQVCV